MTRSVMAEGPLGARRRPGLAWDIAKRLFRRSIRWRSRVPLVAAMFTEKEQMLNLAMQYVAFNRVAGDYLEFGCYEGNSFIAAYHLARAQGLEDMRFYAFDSFNGLPAPRGIDQDPGEALQYGPGDFACDVTTFRRHLRSAHVPSDEVRIVEGYYRDSLTETLRDELPIRSAAVVLVDCDYHESARDVLRFITGYVTSGSLLLLDDWYNFKAHPERGEQKALAEWLAENPGIRASPYLNFGWHGRSFTIHREP